MCIRVFQHQSSVALSGFDGSMQPNTQKAEVRGWVSRAHYCLKRHALKQIAVNRAVFDKVKEMLY